MGLPNPRLLLLLGCAVWGSSHAVDFPHCEEPPRPPHTCLHAQCAHGTCVNMTQYGYTIEHCVCDEGWVGYYCEYCCRCQPGEKCDANPWFPGHICTNDSTTVLTTTTADASPAVTNDSTTVLSTTTTDASPTESTTKTCLFPSRNSSQSCPWGSCGNGNCTKIDKDSFFCECDEGWRGFYCDTCCDLKCVNGNCFLHSLKQIPYCGCDPGYIGDLCDVVKPTEPPVTVTVAIKFSVIPDWTWYVIGLAVIIIVALLMAAYILWLNRNIYILRMIHFIETKRFPDSIDDGNLYDAYLAFAEEDARFAWTLCWYLESKGFLINMKGRDSVWGAAQYEDIQSAVDQSRRTILLISPRFLESDWPLFQVQEALLASLKRRHGIIPVIVNDISGENTDRLVGRIMETWRCVRWPTNTTDKMMNMRKIKKFWARVELAMPHYKRSNDPESGHVCGKSETTLF